MKLICCGGHLAQVVRPNAASGFTSFKEHRRLMAGHMGCHLRALMGCQCIQTNGMLELCSTLMH